MQTLLTNDWHLGPTRTAGTTPASAKAIRNYVADACFDLIMQHLDKNLIVNGDLLDQFSVDNATVDVAWKGLSEWCKQSDPEAKLFLLAGNHDLSARGDKVSSFELVCRIMSHLYPEKVYVALAGGVHQLLPHIWAIPHCLNSDLFDLELSRAFEQVQEGDILLLHANYVNNFAVHSDHSLNLTQEWADKFYEKGVKLVFGHEHDARKIRGGLIAGNQFPTSVADCLSPCGYKAAHIIKEDLSIEEIKTLDLDTVFIEVPWDQIGTVTSHPFVRATGDVTQDQMADVLKALARYRLISSAFVVANGVKVQGSDLSEFQEISFDQIKAFDVLGELMALLDEKERQIVTNLLED